MKSKKTQKTSGVVCNICYKGQVRKNGYRKDRSILYKCLSCGTTKRKNFTVLGQKKKYNYSFDSQDVLNYGLDYLRFQFSVPFGLDGAISLPLDVDLSPYAELWNICYSIDKDNNNVRFNVSFLGFDFDEVRRNGDYYTFVSDSVSLFQLKKMSRKQSNRFFDPSESGFILDVYGLVFATDRIGICPFDYRKFLKKFIFSFGIENSYLSRLDFMFDIKKSVSFLSFSENFGSERQSFRGLVSKELETVYFSGGENERKGFTRVYNKTLSVKKNKAEVFYPYIIEQEKDVSRVEFQIHSEFFKECDFVNSDLFDNKKIFSLIRSFCQTQRKNFSFDFSSPLIKRKYRSSMVAREDYYVKKLSSSFINMDKLKIDIDSVINKTKNLYL